MPNIGVDYPPRLQDWGGGHVPGVPPRGAAYGPFKLSEWRLLATTASPWLCQCPHALYLVSCIILSETFSERGVDRDNVAIFSGVRHVPDCAFSEMRDTAAKWCKVLLFS